MLLQVRYNLPCLASRLGFPLATLRVSFGGCALDWLPSRRAISWLALRSKAKLLPS